MAKGWGRPKPGALNSASHVGGGNPSTWIINYCDGFYFMRQIKNVWASSKYVPAILITCLQKVFHILCGRLKLGIGLFLLYFAQVCLHAMSKFFSIHVGLFIRGKGGRRWNRREHTNTLPANPQKRNVPICWVSPNMTGAEDRIQEPQCRSPCECRNLDTWAGSTASKLLYQQEAENPELGTHAGIFDVGQE